MTADSRPGRLAHARHAARNAEQQAAQQAAQRPTWLRPLGYDSHDYQPPPPRPSHGPDRDRSFGR